MSYERMLAKEIVPIDNIIKKHMIMEAIQRYNDVIITPVSTETSFYDCFIADKIFKNIYHVAFSFNIKGHTYSVARTLITKDEEVDLLCLNSLKGY